MEAMFDRFKFDRMHAACAAGVLIVTFLLYNATKAPTLSFWDCGEFIACAFTLGIPHPPGTPLYIMLGRIFSIIPFQADISARVNLLSAASGAVAAMLAFLVTFRLIRRWWSSDQFLGWKKAAAYIGALVGTSMFAFGRTHWNNSLEAEVYTPAMLFIMLMFWLALRWLERREERESDLYLLAIMYLGFLSMGVHMTALLFMPAIFLLVIFHSPRLRRDPLFYVTGVCLFSIAVSFDLFMYATAVWLVVLIVGAAVVRRYAWTFSLLLVLAAIVGFSCQLYTPIRSSQDPAINQNDPSSSFAVFKKFIERKQYGEELMLVRALKRRGEWINQLGMHERTGFWGFFSQQYGINGRPFAFLFVLGLLGLFELVRRHPRLGGPFVLMVLLGTVFLVWYMNFADGTRMNPVTGDGHTEVRDRDYFFTPGFIIFGMAIGLGVSGLMEMARESIMGKLRLLRRPVMILTSVPAILAAVPVMANYYYCDRSRNYAPYDFAYNLLVSCEPDAILFNGGDNDTFPVWCLQAVYGIRPDVTAVNLSLANTDWYIKQIRDYMGIPLRWSDLQIAGLRHQTSRDGRMYRIQDQVVDEMLTVNQWRRPVDFALTVASDARQYRGRSLQNNLVLQGMVYRLDREERPGVIDMERCRDLFWNKFKFRSLADSTVYKDDRTLALSGNYTTALLLMADSLQKTKQYDQAIEVTQKALEIMPYDYETYNFLAQLYVEAGRENLIPTLLTKVPRGETRRIYFVWGMANKYNGQRDKAKALLKTALDSFPTFEDAFREYSLLLYEDKQMDMLQQLLRTWLMNNPKDDKARRAMQELFKTPPTPSSPPGN